MDGLLLVDKPSGWTSFDAVNYVRKTIAQAAGVPPMKIKVGHTGTLDPLATGLLVLVVGTYTRRAQEFSKLDKKYEVGMHLGMTSSTGDEEGEKTVVSDFRPDKEAVLTVMSSHIGTLQQVPPAYSAVKVNGVRAYQAARAGKPLELQAREVNVYDLTEIAYTYPDCTFTAHVSSGTYIRTLVEDMGHALKTGAYMTSLRRTTVGNFMITAAIKLPELTIEAVSKNLQQLPE